MATLDLAAGAVVSSGRVAAEIEESARAVADTIIGAGSAPDDDAAPAR